ncbi:MAG: hypothetical protein SNJ81_15310, partial [Cyanobacteriota bacterium]
MNPYSLLAQTTRERVSDGAIAPILASCEPASKTLVLIWPQLGDFDSLEYAWWIRRQAAQIGAAG